MIQIKNLQALCAGDHARSDAVVYVQVTPAIGFLHSFSQPVIYIDRESKTEQDIRVWDEITKSWLFVQLQNQVGQNKNSNSAFTDEDTLWPERLNVLWIVVVAEIRRR